MRLFLASVVVEFASPGPDGPQTPLSAIQIRDAFMGHPAVVTVRPDGHERRWLYRVDLESTSSTPPRAPALRPAMRVARDLGLVADVRRFSLMSPAEREVFHARFDPDATVASRPMDRPPTTRRPRCPA